MSRRKPTPEEDIEQRLARIAGHANSLRKMWAEEADCDDLLVQISAVVAALEQAGKVILQRHVRQCVAQAVESGRGDDAVRKLSKALDRF